MLKTALLFAILFPGIGVHYENNLATIDTDGFLSDYISLAESWAEHVGQTFADRMYGANSTQVAKQGIGYVNDAPVFGLTSHLNSLEDFSPSRTNDPFRWIPDGLYYDLIDDRNDQFVANPRVLINDAVLGYTNQQFFNALDNDVKSLPQFRVRLLNENGSNQAFQVTQLFNGYGY